MYDIVMVEDLRSKNEKRTGCVPRLAKVNTYGAEIRSE